MAGNRILIIGGSDAGISAALRAREIDQSVEPTLVVADSYPNFSICGLPFYLSGEVSDWRRLAHRTRDEIEQAGIRLLLNHSATAIAVKNKSVQVVDEQGRESQLSYDRLVIGTGAESIKPNIKGIDLPGVFLLRWMQDSFAVHKWLTESNPKSALIVGGGYIGMEMADALILRGLSVTVVEFAETVLTTVDGPLGGQVATELQRHGVKVATGVGIESIEADGKGLIVHGTKGFSAEADLVLVAVGCRPSTTLAAGAGIETGFKGAIKVNRRMQTNVSDIYAAGDCVETWHHILNRYTYLPLGTTAHKQGRVAGENAVGGNREYAGSLGTQAVKIFDVVAARTGFRDSEAQEGGFDPFTDQFETWDHKVYYPEAEKMNIRITGDRATGRLLGAQILGHRKSEVSKRIDICAAALFNNMTVEQLSDLDLSYTPPLSSPWDPVQMAAQAWVKKLHGLSASKSNGQVVSECLISKIYDQGAKEMGKPKVLFLCTHNSARSQMAEAFLRKFARDRFDAYSAGFEPTELHPFTKKVMEEVGFDMSGHQAKPLKQFLGRTLFTYLITVCQRNEEECPIFPGTSIRLDWAFEDPAAFQGTEDEKLNKFREIRDQIRVRIESWLQENS